MDPLSILHVSDLHRDPKNEVRNKALLLSLEQDRDRYRTETPKIPDPNLIIASGDIIHGVKHDAADAEAELPAAVRPGRGVPGGARRPVRRRRPRAGRDHPGQPRRQLLPRPQCDETDQGEPRQRQGGGCGRDPGEAVVGGGQPAEVGLGRVLLLRGDGPRAVQPPARSFLQVLRKISTRAGDPTASSRRSSSTSSITPGTTSPS